MTLLLSILVAILIFLIVYTYFIYPVLVSVLATDKQAFIPDKLPFRPKVYILIAAYNEEKIIGKKLETLVQFVDLENVKVLIGSDGSTDATHQIVESFSQKYHNISLLNEEGRNGKARMLNRLFAEVKKEATDLSNTILILTDANVLFSESTISQLILPFSNAEIAQVGANVVNYGMKTEGISGQEKFYIQSETKLKVNEGKAFGCMMAAFGACYALRASYMPLIPANQLMEDFFISIDTLRQGGKSILNEKSICYEDLPLELEQEYKRKKRISAGNFQNLAYFWKPLLNPFSKLGFVFISHKLLRWLTPLFGLLIALFSLFLYTYHGLFKGIVYLTLAIVLLALLDRFASKLKIHFLPLRYLSYFFFMNMAIFQGFFVYLKGIRNSAWQPTKRV